MNEKKQIPVTHKSDGRVVLTEPVRQQTPRVAASLFSTTSKTYVPSEFQGNINGLQQTEIMETVENVHSNISDTVSKAKSKQEITTLQQFISYAYGRKGQPLSVKSKVLQAISQNMQISEEGLAALQKLAISDRQFCVPRQILLTSREVDGFPAITAALRSFVQDLMLCHPVFKNPKVASAIRNLPEAPLPSAALKILMAEVVAEEKLYAKDLETKDGERVARKTVDLDELRVNAANCMAVWFVINRRLSLDDVTDALYEAIWEPTSRVTDRDATRLRALTGIEKSDGVGLACEVYKRRSVIHAANAVCATSEVDVLRRSLTEVQMQLEKTSNVLYETKSTLVDLQQETAKEKDALQKAAETESAHLRDDLKQLRSRVLRRLITDVEMLGVGLSAIQGMEPRIHVIRDRVERVIDALHSEINKLREV